MGTTLVQAIATAAAALQPLTTRQQTDADEAVLHDLHSRLTQLARLHNAQDSEAAAFADAAQQAWDGLCREYPDPEVGAAMEVLLSVAAPILNRFRQLAVEELLLGSTSAAPAVAAMLAAPTAPKEASLPDMGRLLDNYRRVVRWEGSPRAETLPPWSTIEPPLRLFFQTLFPEALAEHPAGRDLLPTPRQRAALSQARRHAASEQSNSLTRIETRIESLLAELSSAPPRGAPGGQSIIASEGSSIAGISQTIVVGQEQRAETDLSPSDLESLYRRYQGFLVETFGLLDFRGILQFQNVVRLRLNEVYVPLLGRRAHSARSVAPPAPARQPARPFRFMQRDAASLHDPISLHHLVRDCPFLVVLGDPGAGKSTLVRSILLALAEGTGYHHFGLEGAWLPIFFPVATFAEARSAPGTHNLSPFDYLSAYYTGLSQPDYGPLFARALLRGRALVLFDGLDEVRSDRMSLVRCLEAFVRQWDAPGNRFVATSRIAGYDDAPLDDSLFTRATVQPLSDEGIRCFIRQWSSAYEHAGAEDLPTAPEISAREIERRIEARAQDLSAAVFTNPNVTALARSPLLLTILSLIHHQGASLPDRRVDLYRLCVEALAETWNRTRSLSGREIDVYLGSEKLDERFVVNLLGPAALWMQEEQPGGMVERRELERHLAHTLVQTDGLAYGRAQRLAQNFVDLMQRDTGLLQERGYQKYGFLHLTFEEYLAARALLESVTVSDPDSLIHARCTDPGWREVLRLMVAAASQREAQRLLLHLLNAPTSAETRGRPLVLAGECLLDIGRNSATQQAWNAVVDQLVALPGEPTPLHTRLVGGQVLGQLGDPRLLDPLTGDSPTGGYWREVEEGTFWFGAEHAGQPPRQVELAHAYRVGCFPVTNAEYRRFIEAGGYEQPRWWSATGWLFLQLDCQPTPAQGEAEQAIAHPGHWHHPSFNAPNQPVVGVSWYEAAAYCAWLTAEGHRAGWLPRGKHIRLPTALEWERTARHTDQRCYPWGNADPDTTRANYDQAELHAPAPVGCFPAGAAVCGALDLSGNVWEWTATPWDRPDQREPRPDFDAAEKPLIRGGAFNWSSDYLHCGAHYWFSPGHRQNLLGFRLVWCPAHAWS
jgi:formylglycine-generating enzyme required for sulfatase activity